jgi:8-oxo-dGTP pyrophosphatase MutT (NUDIX family)
MHNYFLPISVKGIVIENGSVWLRKNERDEWELPGGKLEKGEQPEGTVVRELYEELGFTVKVIDILQAHLYKIKRSQDESRGVLVVSYLCNLINKTGKFEHLGEAGKAEFKKFTLDQIPKLKMPKFYKDAINKAIQIPV